MDFNDANSMIDKIRMLLNENKISMETSVTIINLLVMEKFKSLGDMNNIYIKTLHRIKMILEDDTLDDFECVENIVVVFENLDIGVEYRHDFG